MTTNNNKKSITEAIFCTCPSGPLFKMMAGSALADCQPAIQHFDNCRIAGVVRFLEKVALIKLPTHTFPYTEL